jgi:CHASE3 domain sensor protein
MQHMRIPVFWRILLGYSAILLLSVGLSAYSIIQLGNLSTTARAALETDTLRITTVEALTDAFLSEVRYAGRFIITHSKELYDQQRQFRSDFGRSMKDLQALSSGPEIQSRLARIADLHSRYNDLFEREVQYIRSAQPYGESRYKQEKEKVLESTLRQLELLKTLSQKSLQTNLKGMEEAASDGRTLAFATTLILVGVGLALSYKISKSITAPLLELRCNAAAPQSYADAGSDYSRIPEIQDLSETLRQAKDHVRAAHASNAAFVRRISVEFATPLISLKNRLNHLKTSLAETVTSEQRTNLIILADETERLIQGCAQIEAPTPPAVPLPQEKAFRAPAVRGADASLIHRTLSLLAGIAGALVQPNNTNDHGKEKNHGKRQRQMPDPGSSARPS